MAETAGPKHAILIAPSWWRSTLSGPAFLSLFFGALLALDNKGLMSLLGGWAVTAFFSLVASALCSWNPFKNDHFVLTEKGIRRHWGFNRWTKLVWADMVRVRKGLLYHTISFRAARLNWLLKRFCKWGLPRPWLLKDTGGVAEKARAMLADRSLQLPERATEILRWYCKAPDQPAERKPD